MRYSRKNIYEINIWPGFVDILGTLLIVTIFTVLISTVTQIYFNDQLDIKRGEISSLDNQINDLINQIDTIDKEKKIVEKKFTDLTKNFTVLKKQKLNLEHDLKSIQEDLAKKQYLLKMKDKELVLLVDEKGDLLNNLQEKNAEISVLSELEKKNSLEIYELNRNVTKLNKRLRELSKLLIVWIE